MDAATLYTVVTMLSGREHIGRHEFPSVAKCEEKLKQMNNRQIAGLPTRYSCERHIRISRAVKVTDYRYNRLAPWMR